MIIWFLKRYVLLKGERLVKVVSWWPTWGKYGLEWPCMRIDRYDGQRSLVAPVWDWMRIKTLFKREQ